MGFKSFRCHVRGPQPGLVKSGEILILMRPGEIILFQQYCGGSESAQSRFLPIKIGCRTFVTYAPEKWESENGGEVERIPNGFTGLRVTSAVWLY